MRRSGNAHQVKMYKACVSSIKIKCRNACMIQGECTLNCILHQGKDTVCQGREFDPGRSHTFVEINHEIIYTAILLPSAESFNKGGCQLQAKVCARSTGKLLSLADSGKCVDRCT